jgi:hypothetical protein
MTDNDAGRSTNANRIDAAPGSAAASTLAVERRWLSRREEWRTQTVVAELLKRHLPVGCFASALDNTPRSARAGQLAKLRGTRAGIPDWVFIWRGEIIWVELKSCRGIASKIQRQVRDELLAAGVKFWFLTRSPRACLLALHLAGVPLIEWKPPKKIERWEGPFENPHARLPQHPVVARERAAAQQRYRQRQRARETARLAAACGGAAGAGLEAGGGGVG